MTAAWLHYPASHPWMPSLKRKSPEDSESDSPQESISPPSSRPFAHQPKRRRFDLSRNLSLLSLVEPKIQTQPVIQEPPSYEETTPSSGDSVQSDLDISPWNGQSRQGPYTSPDMDMDTPIYDGAQPVVEEPFEKAASIHEVHMHNSSSYEPEKDRIVVTDLDSSEDESETNSETSPDDSGFTVSPAFLSRIQLSKPPLLKPLPPSDCADSRALVLFRPSPWSAQNTQQLNQYYSQRDSEQKDNNMEYTAPPVEEESDAMEIE